MVAGLSESGQASRAEDWVLPSLDDPSEPCPRRTLLKWWKQAERLAEIDHVPGLGYHTLRRRFATDLKTTNLRDLCSLGGWKCGQTVVTVYQQPEFVLMKQALDSRTKRTTGQQERTARG